MQPQQMRFSKNSFTITLIQLNMPMQPRMSLWGSPWKKRQSRSSPFLSFSCCFLFTWGECETILNEIKIQMKIEECVREVSLKLSRMWERRCRRADCRGGYEETNAGVDMKQRENKYFAHTCVRNTDISTWMFPLIVFSSSNLLRALVSSRFNCSASPLTEESWSKLYSYKIESFSLSKW